MIKFTAEQKLQALNLLKEGYSSYSVAQIIDAGSHQTIDTLAAQCQHFGLQGLENRQLHIENDYLKSRGLSSAQRRSMQEERTIIQELRH